MLVLTRTETQTIHVDGPATITIVAIKPTRVKVGIDAPPTTNIRRGEIDRKEAA